MRRLTPWIVALATLATTVTAHAQNIDGSVQLEYGRMANNDPGYDLFNDRNRMPSWGVRGGASIGEHLSIIGGWHRVRRGSETWAYYEGEDSFYENQLSAAYYADQFTLGPKVGIKLGEIVYPYASVEGMLFRSVIRFDDDTSTKNNLGQVMGAGMAPGLVTAAGAEFRSQTGVVGLMIAFHFDLGYAWVNPVTYGTLGDIQPGGLMGRGGIGLRF